MVPTLNLFRTSMPESRPADLHLGCLNGSVYMDFDVNDENEIQLVRISFDGYGCCESDEYALPLNFIDSEDFLIEIEKEEFDQDQMSRWVFHMIYINRSWIWQEALKEYNLIHDLPM